MQHTGSDIKNSVYDCPSASPRSTAKVGGRIKSSEQFYRKKSPEALAMNAPARALKRPGWPKVLAEFPFEDPDEVPEVVVDGILVTVV
jgi:hypothetical protein